MLSKYIRILHSAEKKSCQNTPLFETLEFVQKVQSDLSTNLVFLGYFSLISNLSNTKLMERSDKTKSNFLPVFALSFQTPFLITKLAQNSKLWHDT